MFLFINPRQGALQLLKPAFMIIRDRNSKCLLLLIRGIWVPRGHGVCGIFYRHGPWGHVVAKRVRESVPSSLLCNWQEALTSLTTSVGMDADVGLDRSVDKWRQSCLKAYASIEREIKQNTKIDSFRWGTTALTIVKQRRLSG
ncbi:hypothetical protein LWI28_019755 [Acer negundo]|uniref:Uncharacterized protein n=1 Tax=Acer negundo TaxID=4023 RepID=A0AAD5IGB1_ACENE|nr:hypothetical protein LWI28_019755 [Acer negundo]